MHKMFRFLFWVALTVGVLIGALRLTAIRWLRVPANDRYLTASISPSVRGGDLIVLWRLTRPGLGYLVLCPEPKHPERFIIGRIVGEENDSVEIKAGRITLNGKALPSDGNCVQSPFTELSPETGAMVEQSCSMEEVGGSLHQRGDVPTSDSHAPSEVKVERVPEGHVWLVSDNRLFPYDSRDFGPVPRNSCTETVFFRLVGSGGFFDTANRNQYIR